MSDPAHPSPAVAAEKVQVRRQVLAARRAMPAGVRQAAARRLQAALVSLVTGAGTVAAYAPFGTEPGGPDLPAVLARALGPGGRLLLPVLRDDRDLDWQVYGSPERLSPAAVSTASLVVVPAVAVDRRGLRLGRGGGSYDRALARVAAGTDVVALLYDGELRDDPLPADPHDRAVTAVLTPAHGLHRL